MFVQKPLEYQQNNVVFPHNSDIKKIAIASPPATSTTPTLQPAHDRARKL
ncbi:MAG: hypothetical protein PUP90_06230 [Nostoc sp. S4]|nr:hypothetical protein [Nostoc sp. S4]